MRIELALFASLTAYLPASAEAGSGGAHSRTIDLPDGTTVGQVIASLDLPDQARVIFVNGRHAPGEHVLAAGERLAIFPPVAGG
jgi:sulfur carrier protein ThiS